jgi:hypothetical protein
MGVVAAELVFWSWLYCFGSLLPGRLVLLYSGFLFNDFLLGWRWFF